MRYVKYGNAEDVMPTSFIKIKCICDYWGKEFLRQNNTRQQAIGFLVCSQSKKQEIVMDI